VVNIDKQVAHWTAGAIEDLETAAYLLSGGKIRPSLFFAHPALDKLMKAHVCRATQELAPKVHNLRWLAQTAGLQLPREIEVTLARMNEFNLEGRYPEMLPAPPSQLEAARYVQSAKEAFEWLQQRL
jgi:HEPN domain-containing protein